MTPTNETGSTPTPSSHSTRLDKTPVPVCRILQGWDGDQLSCSSDERSLKSSEKLSRKVLDEEDFTKSLETIIQRDFYPEIPRLRAQNEYLAAHEVNDVQKIRELQMKYSLSRQRRQLTDEVSSAAWTPQGFDETPAGFETPDVAVELTKHDTKNEGLLDDGRGSSLSAATSHDAPTNSHQSNRSITEAPSKDESVDLKLDTFLSKYSSEDNASFDELMSEEERKRRIKYWWMYEAAREHEKRYLPGRPQQLALCDRDRANDVDRKAKVLDNWTYKAKNDVLWVPDGAEWTSEERVKRAKMAEQMVVHDNTRFKSNPFPGSHGCQTQDSMSKAVGVQAALNKGKVNPQGCDAFKNPQQNLGPVVTPSPIPGIDDESPLMTWGEIDGTPFRLDGGDTPLLPGAGPSFKVPEIPKRDQLALTLAEDASRLHRQRKKKAMMQVSSSLISPRIGSSKSIERLSSMSPAARRLATSKLGIRVGTDKALKAAYTPSPVRQSPRRTPISARKVPSSRGTPGSQRGSSSVATEKLLRNTTPKTQSRTESVKQSSLTDNLLSLNKCPEENTATGRSKAEDFF